MVTEPDVLGDILAIFDFPDTPEMREYVTRPDPWRLMEQRYREALPGLLAAIAEEISAGLPGGVRFVFEPSPPDPA